ncbi:hypothetical protein BC628DRAFT_1501297 [Trametes gibbosa]|nr:hypothetical protein BC628DRAFT_1501297 [Trametes gibbosa]
MSYKENSTPTHGVFVKPEPEEPRIAPLAASGSWQAAAAAAVLDVKPLVKPEPADATRLPPSNQHPGNESLKRQDLFGSQNGLAGVPCNYFKKYQSISEIDYVHEEALKEGLGMVKTIKINLKSLNVDSKMRQEVWMKEIKSLENQGAPSTMIAVCGATGAGKSSTLNAILDDTVVPTSGMRACTAVVTEIAYHKKKTIDGDVSFLTEQEWRDELKVLLDDLVDEDGNVKRSTDLRSDAGVAWSKVHAVYPNISQDQMVRMNADQIIARDPKIAKLLGTTKHISAPGSRTFAKEISKYIDSKDQKRGDKKDKKKDKDKKDKDKDGPAYWPLIRQVRVWCNARALATGAILVDLPGVADANAARNNIAKDYMKKCDCVWILAPITRAVDDKTARDLMGDAFRMQLMMDGNYDSNTITFIASKCDDISCSEVEKKTSAEEAAKDVDAQLKRSRALLQEYQAHLHALENGEHFEPVLTKKKAESKPKSEDGTDADSNSGSDADSASESEQEEQPMSKKRKHKDDGKRGSAKKLRASAASENESAMAVDEDEDLMDDEEELNFSDSDDEEAKSHAGSSSSDSDSDAGSDDERDEDVEGEVEEEVTRKEAVDLLATLKKRQNKAQREKNAFCSLKRSEFSRDVLKEDFRTGLKDLDDAQQEQQNPDTFDPSVNVRDYNAIDLPVFTVSARDYIRITGQVKGDGDPTCFSKTDDTGIPSLQQWCHHLTVASRSRAARNFHAQLNTFCKNVLGFLQGIGEVAEADRAAMPEKWESSMVAEGNMSEEDPDEDRFAYTFGAGWASSEPYDQPMLNDILEGGAGTRLYSLNKQTKVDRYGQPVGVAPRLEAEFRKLSDGCVDDLQERFRDGLEERCRVGAASASSAAVETSDALAAAMHWATYRATLRRHGSWRQDLNVELSNPFTRQIASSWAKVFEADLFASFEKSTLEVIQKLIGDVTASAAPGLQERARGQGELAMDEARVALKKTLEIKQLVDGYNRAMDERGRGSVARQKTVFHDYVVRIKDEVFTGAADVILGRLSQAAEAVDDALEDALQELARKIEVNMAVLWEGPRDDPKQAQAHAEVVDTVKEILQQVEMWRGAEQLSHVLNAITQHNVDAMGVEPPALVAT